MRGASCRQSGMTLLEMLLAVTLLGMVAASFGFLYGAANRFMIQSINMDRAQGEASFALEHIQRHLQRATAITAPAVGNIPVSRIDFTWRPNVGGAAQNSAYRLNGTNLTFFPAVNGPGEIVARDVLAITFTRISQSTVQVILQARPISGGDVRRVTLRTTVNSRGIF